MTQEIIITSCHKCPFCNKDNKYGDDGCNISNEVSRGLKYFDQLPREEISELCPLKLEGEESFLLRIESLTVPT